MDAVYTVFRFPLYYRDNDTSPNVTLSGQSNFHVFWGRKHIMFITNLSSTKVQDLGLYYITLIPIQHFSEEETKYDAP